MKNCEYVKGQIVCLLILEGSNAYRYAKYKPREKRFVKGFVKSVGRKYITVEVEAYEYRFDAEDEHTQIAEAGGIDYKLFPGKEHAEEYLKRQDLFFMVRENFEMRHFEDFSLDQLLRIAEILTE